MTCQVSLSPSLSYAEKEDQQGFGHFLGLKRDAGVLSLSQ